MTERPTMHRTHHPRPVANRPVPPRLLPTVAALCAALVLLSSLASAVLAQVTIEVGSGGDVTVTGPAERVTLVQTEPPGVAPDTPTLSPPDLAPDAEPPTVDDAPVPPTSPIADAGFTAFTPHAAARTFYVAADGDDQNAGTSPDVPLRTLAAGYAKLRHKFGDHLLLKAGDTFTVDWPMSWRKSGRDAQHPLVVGVYGDGPRPRLLTTGSGFLYTPPNAVVDFVAVQGLDVRSPRRDPAATNAGGEGFPWREYGVYWLAGGESITFEDCKLAGFIFNFAFHASPGRPLHDVTVRRCIVVDSFGHWTGSIAGHSSGLYAEQVVGLTLEENLFDHNGWFGPLHGTGRTIFNHNLYLNMTTRDTVVRSNVIARGASHGLQLRGGGLVENNLFARNALALFVALRESRVVHNVIAESDDIRPDQPDRQRGMGLEVLPTPSAFIARNLFLDKRGRAGHGAAIMISEPRDFADRPDTYRVVLDDNVVVNWPVVPAGRSYLPNADRAEVAGSETTRFDTASGGAHFNRPHPQRSLDSYHDGGFEAWLELLRNRPRGTWDARHSAAGINAYLFAGHVPDND